MVLTIVTYFSSSIGNDGLLRGRVMSGGQGGLGLRSVNRLVADWLDVGLPLVSLPAGRANGRDGVHGRALGSQSTRRQLCQRKLDAVGS